MHCNGLDKYGKKNKRTVNIATTDTTTPTPTTDINTTTTTSLRAVVA